ncbi:MAG: uracil-DNA glycosylase [Candidatus Sungbacteria bacterium]|uniref:Type-4 uracil-DNA glycosylase n=1 Tax=Candidatus Sungiibacteriota bacterium TaxID=2750080 RepID=A0A931YCY3_9BACT|nr:uracil-DNA glycosylase [Candidatus Sungbacteria bacterium]MBI2465610.1 uracil-DNA glycosylase [Candidatus Sungbacteria bacterium]
MDKVEQLKELEQELLNDSSLPLREANLVFGEGDINCRVLFIGEAPGFHEDQQKRPFVGRSGQLLNKLIASVGWQREGVYITNIVKRRPPENRDPLPEEIAAYKPYLTRQIDIINPKVIATLGRFSMNFFLPEAKISRDQGKVFKWGKWDEKGEKGKFVVPLFHPAAALRSTQNLKALEDSFKRLPAILERCENYVSKPVAVQTSSAAPVIKDSQTPKLQTSMFDVDVDK